jgi:hypothetical protein
MKFVTDLGKGILGQADSVVLWTDILANIPDSVLLKPNVRILNIACGHSTEAILIAKRMLALGISKEDIQNSLYLIDKYNVFTSHAKSNYGFKNVITADFLTWKTDMKFDVIVGNPPFNKGDILLYPAFFKKSLEMAQTVVMIMPTDIESQQVRLKNHNKLIKKHMISISKNITDSFNVGIPDMRYVIASNTISNTEVAYIDPLDLYQEILPTHKRLYPRRGHGEFCRLANHDNVNGVPCIMSIYRGNRIQWANINKKIAGKVKAKLLTDAPWY